MKSLLPEVWLRGPLPGIPALLQPAAHALTQVREDIIGLMMNFPTVLLWEKPAGRASAGFHLQHIAGVTDRMRSYAMQQSLTLDQFQDLENEGRVINVTTEQLLNRVDEQLGNMLDYISTVKENALTEIRTVGRKQMPSTLGGILFHAAEHAQRHYGQLLVTTSVVLQAHQG